MQEENRMQEEQVFTPKYTPTEAIPVKMFAVIGDDGKPQGFYPTDIYKEIQLPAGAIEITVEAWQGYLSNQQFRKFSAVGELIELPPPTQAELDEIEASRPLTEAEKLVVIQTENEQLKQRLQATESAVLKILDFKEGS